MTRSFVIVASAFGLAHAQNGVTFKDTDVVECSTYDPINGVWVGGNSRGDYLTVAADDGSSKNTPGITDVTTTQGMYYSNRTVYAVGLDFPGNWDGKNSAVAQLLKFDVTNGPVCGDGNTCEATTLVDIQPVIEEAGFSTSQLNDLVVAPSGTTYITDSWNGALISVSSNNEASLFLKTPPEEPVQSSFGKLQLSTNGIEHFLTAQQEEYLLVTLTLNKDALYRVSIPNSGTPTVTKVEVLGDSTWAENIGNDGIRFLPLPLYKNPWEQVNKVTHETSCDCAVDATVQNMNFYAQPGKIFTEFVSTSNCNSFSTIALVYSGDIAGFSHTFRIAVDGELENTPDNLPSVICTMDKVTGDISCVFSNSCVNTFTPERPDKFLGVVGLDTRVRMFYSSDDFKTTQLVGVDNRDPTGYRTTLGIKDQKIWINDLGSFTETASTTTKPFEYQSDWDLVDPSAGDRGCCRFGEDRWAEAGKENAVRATSLSQCQEACSADSSCIAIEYVPQKFKCEIHIATPTKVSPAQECLCLLKPDVASSGTMTFLSKSILGALLYAVFAI